jgi:hypothetical protein
VHEFLLPNSRTSRFLASRRHPDQAALLARIPLLGRRVPMRGYWRRQAISAQRMCRHAMREAADVLRATGFSSGRDARGVLKRRRAHRHDRASYEGTGHRSEGRRREARRREGRRGEGRRREGRRREGRGGAVRVARMDGTREWWQRPPRLGVPMLIVGASVGALCMFVCDPHQGRRRRALLRDRLVHMKNVMTRDMPARVEKRGRFFRGVAKGIAHETADALAMNNGHPAADNETLVARVRSEVLRNDNIKAGEIHIEAYDGCVTLRGQLERPEEIRNLVRETENVEGVRDVRNFLHLPGTPPPNMLEVYGRWEMPSHTNR